MGQFTLTEESIFGYGGVLYVPQDWLPFKGVFDDITFHYNVSDNFIPQTERVDQYREPVDSPTGTSKDFGISFYMMDNKVVTRLNWFKSHMINASSSQSGTFNRNMVRIFQWWGRLNRDLFEFADEQPDGSWTIKQSVIDDEIEIDPDTGLDTEFGLPLEEAVVARWPNLQDASDGRAAFNPYLEDERLADAFNLRYLPDGDTNTQWAGTITDTEDVFAEGFEAEIILNPTDGWRISFNAAQQQVVRENIAPRLTEPHFFFGSVTHKLHDRFFVFGDPIVDDDKDISCAFTLVGIKLLFPQMLRHIVDDILKGKLLHTFIIHGTHVELSFRYLVGHGLGGTVLFSGF